VKPRFIARTVTDLSRRLVRRLYELIVPVPLANTTCFIVMGSGGRGEQLLRTDQDNGFILREADRSGTLPAAATAFTEALIELGFPRCPGNIMVSNPDWAKPLAAYKADLFRWVEQPDEKAQLNLAIFYDAAAAAGDATLLHELKAYLFHLLENHRSAVQLFARATLAFKTPLGWFDRLVLEKAPHAGELDIKKGGIFPIVHGVRSLALEHRLAETNSLIRLHALGGKGLFDERFGTDLSEAFEFLSMLRLRVQLACWEQGTAWNNYVNPQHLSTLERVSLKQSLRVVKQFKALINHHFKLDMFY
jgi:CBS domain-containing protein